MLLYSPEGTTYVPAPSEPPPGNLPQLNLTDEQAGQAIDSLAGQGDWEGVATLSMALQLTNAEQWARLKPQVEQKLADRINSGFASNDYGGKGTALAHIARADPGLANTLYERTAAGVEKTHKDDLARGFYRGLGSSTMNALARDADGRRLLQTVKAAMGRESDGVSDVEKRYIQYLDNKLSTISQGQQPPPEEAAGPDGKKDGYTEAQAAADAITLANATVRDGDTFFGIKISGSGIGTNDPVVWATLEPRSAHEIQMIRDAYRKEYDRDLDADLRGEFSGPDLDHVNALLAGGKADPQGGKVRNADADAVAIYAEIDGTFGDEQRVLHLLENAPPEHRHAIAEAFAAKYGGASSGQSAEQFLLSRFEAGFSNLSGDDQLRARALLVSPSGKPNDPAAADANAEAAAGRLHTGLYRSMDWVPWRDKADVDSVLDTLRANTDPQQMERIAQAYERIYHHKLEDALHERLDGGDRDMGLQLLHPLAPNADAKTRADWEANNGAARVRFAIGTPGDWDGTREGVLRSTFEGKSAEQIQAIALAYFDQYAGDSEKSAAGTDKPGAALALMRRDIAGDLGGGEKPEILHLLDAPSANDKPGLAQWQYDHDARRLKLAVDGIGIDKDLTREVLAGKTKAEIDGIAASYQRQFGHDLRSRLADELGDSREGIELLEQDFDVGSIDMSDRKAAAAELILRGDQRRDFERSGVANSVSNFEYGADWLTVLQRDAHVVFNFDTHYRSDSQLLDRDLAQAQAALDAGDVDGAFQKAEVAQIDLQTLTANKDATTNLAAEAVVLAVTLPIVCLSGGTLAPVEAVILGAFAGAAAAGGTYYALDGQVGTDEVGRHALIGAAEGATAGVPLGRAGAVGKELALARRALTAAQKAAPRAAPGVSQAAVLRGAGAVARAEGRVAAATAARDALPTGLGHTLKDGAIWGAGGGGAYGAVDAATRHDTWTEGFGSGLLNIVKDTALSAATGVVMAVPMSAGFHGAMLGVGQGTKLLRERKTAAAAADEPQLEPAARDKAAPGDATPAKVAADGAAARRVSGPDSMPGPHAVDVRPPAGAARPRARARGNGNAAAVAPFRPQPQLRVIKLASFFPVWEKQLARLGPQRSRSPNRRRANGRSGGQAPAQRPVLARGHAESGPAALLGHDRIDGAVLEPAALGMDGAARAGAGDGRRPATLPGHVRPGGDTGPGPHLRLADGGALPPRPPKPPAGPPGPHMAGEPRPYGRAAVPAASRIHPDAPDARIVGPAKARAAVLPEIAERELLFVSHPAHPKDASLQTERTATLHGPGSLPDDELLDIAKGVFEANKPLPGNRYEADEPEDQKILQIAKELSALYVVRVHDVVRNARGEIVFKDQVAGAALTPNWKGKAGVHWLGHELPPAYCYLSHLWAIRGAGAEVTEAAVLASQKQLGQTHLGFYTRWGRSANNKPGAQTLYGWSSLGGHADTGLPRYTRDGAADNALIPRLHISEASFTPDAARILRELPETGTKGVLSRDKLPAPIQAALRDSQSTAQLQRALLALPDPIAFTEHMPHNVLRASYEIELLHEGERVHPRAAAPTKGTLYTGANRDAGQADALARAKRLNLIPHSAEFARTRPAADGYVHDGHSTLVLGHARAVYLRDPRNGRLFNANWLWDEHGEVLSPYALARRLREWGYEAGPVLILSCNLDPAYLRALADELGAKVFNPPDVLPPFVNDGELTLDVGELAPDADDHMPQNTDARAIPLREFAPGAEPTSRPRREFAQPVVPEGHVPTLTRSEARQRPEPVEGDGFQGYLGATEEASADPPVPLRSFEPSAKAPARVATGHAPGSRSHARLLREFSQRVQEANKGLAGNHYHDPVTGAPLPIETVMDEFRPLWLVAVTNDDGRMVGGAALDYAWKGADGDGVHPLGGALEPNTAYLKDVFGVKDHKQAGRQAVEAAAFAAQQRGAESLLFDDSRWVGAQYLYGSQGAHTDAHAPDFGAALPGLGIIDVRFTPEAPQLLRAAKGELPPELRTLVDATDSPEALARELDRMIDPEQLAPFIAKVPDRVLRVVYEMKLLADGQHLHPGRAANTPPRRLPVDLRESELAHALHQAWLARDIYDRSLFIPEGSQGVTGWQDISHDAERLARYGLTPEDLQPAGSGFRARVYEPEPDLPGGPMPAQLVFRGSEPRLSGVRDWANNLQQAVGLRSEYYTRAVAIGRKLEAADAEIELTGHSLGGGLASAAALVSGRRATTFDAAGLSQKLRRSLRDGGAPLHDDVEIRAYHVEGEVLTALQGHSPLPAAWGEPTLVPAPKQRWALPGTGRRFDLGPLTIRVPRVALPAEAVRRHMMGPMIDGIERMFADARAARPRTGGSYYTGANRVHAIDPQQGLRALPDGQAVQVQELRGRYRALEGESTPNTEWPRHLGPTRSASPAEPPFARFGQNEAEMDALLDRLHADPLANKDELGRLAGEARFIQDRAASWLGRRALRLHGPLRRETARLFDRHVTQGLSYDAATRRIEAMQARADQVSEVLARRYGVNLEVHGGYVAEYLQRELAAAPAARPAQASAFRRMASFASLAAQHPQLAAWTLARALRSRAGTARAYAALAVNHPQLAARAAGKKTLSAAKQVGPLAYGPALGVAMYAGDLLSGPVYQLMALVNRGRTGGVNGGSAGWMRIRENALKTVLRGGDYEVAAARLDRLTGWKGSASGLTPSTIRSDVLLLRERLFDVHQARLARDDAVQLHGAQSPEAAAAQAALDDAAITAYRKAPLQSRTMALTHKLGNPVRNLSLAVSTGTALHFATPATASFGPGFEHLTPFQRAALVGPSALVLALQSHYLYTQARRLADPFNAAKRLAESKALWRQAWPYPLVALGDAVTAHMCAASGHPIEAGAYAARLVLDLAMWRLVMKRAQRDQPKFWHDIPLVGELFHPSKPLDPDLKFKATVGVILGMVGASVLAYAVHPKSHDTTGRPAAAPLTPAPTPTPPTTSAPSAPLSVTVRPYAPGNQSFDTLWGIAAAHKDTLLTDEQKRRIADEDLAEDAQTVLALAELLRLNRPRYGFDASLIDGVPTSARGDPDTIHAGMPIIVSRQETRT